MSEKIKNCPFCGGEGCVKDHIFVGLSETYGVVCLDCGCATKQFYTTREEAEKAWNRRAGG